MNTKCQTEGITKKLASMFMTANLVFMLAIAMTNSSLAASNRTIVKNKTIIYAALGNELARYELDPEPMTLTKSGTLKLPENLQFAEFHPCGCILYAVSSNAGSGTTGASGNRHLMSAFKIDAKTGALYPWGESIPLPERPIHMTVDRKGEYALVAYNKTGTVKSYRLAKEGFIGEEVVQSEMPDGGIFTHQVVVTPSNNTAIALGRGNDAVGDRAAETGSYSLFNYRDGHLFLTRKVNYEEGIGPRHLAFHPSKPWVYVGIERTSKLFMYELQDNGELSLKPLFRKETLRDMTNEHRDRQRGGVIRIHPNGKFAYVTNRADGTVKKDGKTISAGGENNIAVFSLDQKTGEPTLVQYIEAQGIEPRTIAFDSTGKILIVANQKAMLVEEQNSLRSVDANLSLFQIGNDGKLEFVRKYDVNAGEKSLLWMDAQGKK